MKKKIEVNQDVQHERKRLAAEARTEFSAAGTLVINLVSSPGAGKTSLLEATAKHWGDSRKMAVLVGDLATERDAQRLAPYTPVEQLTTGGACHLNLDLVKQGLARLGCARLGLDQQVDQPEAQDLEFLFIENIGNLVCPASHDLAEHVRVVVASTTEGDDKPGKYPKMFRTSDAMVVSKTDLLPYVPFSVDAIVADARRIQGDLEVMEVCAIKQQGIAQWCEWLDLKRSQMLESTKSGSAVV